MALSKLLKGFEQFCDGPLQEKQAKYDELFAKGQKPPTCVVACSDSRVAPVVIFNADPGELFVIRNVANIVPPYERGGGYHGTSAALEYAVQHLKVETIVIMGHSDCGGVHALMNPPEEENTKGCEFIPKWVDILGEARVKINETMKNADPQTLACASEKEAVKVSLKNLLTFPCIKTYVERGTLDILGAYVDIRNGKLLTIRPGEQEYTEINK